MQQLQDVYKRQVRLVAAAAVEPQQTHHIQEDVDEVQIQRQCAVDGSLFRQLAVPCVCLLYTSRCV